MVIDVPQEPKLLQIHFVLLFNGCLNRTRLDHIGLRILDAPMMEGQRSSIFVFFKLSWMACFGKIGQKFLGRQQI
jgi:hypothetical protein